MKLTFIPQFFPFVNGKTSFSFDGNQYYWKSGNSRLEDEMGRKLARYDVRFLETKDHILGKLRITEEGRKGLGVNVLVVTALASWQREEEDRLQVRIP